MLRAVRGITGGYLGRRLLHATRMQHEAVGVFVLRPATAARREAAAKLDLNKVLASGPAPRVAFITPAASVGSDDVSVEAEIIEHVGGGIGRIEWRINGVMLGVESRAIKRVTVDSPLPAASRAIIVKRTLALEPGENRIEVVAYNGRDLIASDPAQVVLKWDGEKSAMPPKLHDCRDDTVKTLQVAINLGMEARLSLETPLMWIDKAATWTLAEELGERLWSN